MKNKYLLILLIAVLFGCKKSFDPNNPDVDQFISLVKDQKHDPYAMPKFNVSHIDRLLELARDTSRVKGYPGNPITSRPPLLSPGGREYMILSECLLWTVEGIRNGSGYGSLTLFLIIPGEPPLGLNGREILEARKKYQESWESSGKSLTKWASENPLRNTAYRWY